MNDSTSQIALIQSRLPYTDRRALSEAWFSALHLAADDPRGALARGHRTSVTATSRRERSAPLGRSACGPLRPNAAVSPQPRGAAQRPQPLDAARRLVAPREPRSAEPAALRHRTSAPFRAALAVGLDRERVQLLLRRDGATLHVVALCRPHVAETVRRALALAESHLRYGGAAVRSSVRAFGEGAVCA